MIISTPKLVSFRGSFQNFRRASPLLSYRSPPPGHYVANSALKVWRQSVANLVSNNQQIETKQIKNENESKLALRLADQIRVGCFTWMELKLMPLPSL